MPIAKIKPHENISAEKINKIIDAYNNMESLNAETAQLLERSNEQNQVNQRILTDFIENFSEKIEAQPGIFETLDLYRRIKNSGVIAASRTTMTPVTFSVFYGDTGEIDARPLIEGQVLLNINSPIVKYDVVDGTGTLIRLTAPNSEMVMPTIAINASGYWTVNGASTGVIAEGIGTQGATGPRGLPGKVIRLQASEEDPATLDDVALGTSELACEAFMQTAYLYNNKLYAPKLDGNDQGGFVGNYEVVSDFAVTYAILDQAGKRYQVDSGADTDPNHYTIWINQTNTSIPARGPVGPTGPQGRGAYVHKFYSDMDFNENDASTFFSQLSRANNDNAKFVVVVTGSKVVDNQPIFAGTITNDMLVTQYNNGDYDPTEFNFYLIPIEPTVLVPTITEKEDQSGFDIDWSVQTEVINNIPPVSILHGKGLQPIGRFETKEALRSYLNENINSLPDYFTATIPVDYAGQLSLNVDYVYACVNKEAQFICLGRLSGPQGTQGTQGIQGIKGDTGQTGATGTRGSLLFRYKTEAWNEIGNDKKLSSAPFGIITDVSSSYFESFSLSGRIQAGDYIADPSSNLGLVYYVDNSNPALINVITIANLKGPQGSIGPIPQFRYNSNYLQYSTDGTNWSNLVHESVIKGPAGEAGSPGTSVTIKGTFVSYSGLPSSDQILGDGYMIGTPAYLWVFTDAQNDVISEPVAVGDTYHGFTNVGQIQGQPGADGREVEIAVNDGNIQWRLKDGTWATIVSVASITGTDGRNVEFNVSSAHVQYRYIGDSSWIDLIPLADITGPAGSDGEQGETGSIGPEGPTGPTGKYITAITSTYKESSSTSQPSSGWTSLDTAMAAMSTTNKYLWRRSIITLSDDSSELSPQYDIIAVHGPQGVAGATFSYEDGVLTIDTGA